MINIITTISCADYPWINLAEIKANKKYTVSFKVDRQSQINIHIHAQDGKCISPIPIYGNGFIPNRKYTYPIISKQDGCISINSENQEATIYDICVEEV